ncbi:MAG: histidine phosphatase family protein, partial [Rickettsiales bacterium]|nr:histidine phosphatase family protein [Rickettsiales bacterium]
MIRRLENIFLMRHGNSEANRDIKVYHAIPDHAIKLSPRGIDDAKNAGVAFKHLLSTGSIKIEAGDIRSWNSPYERTRETLGGFMDGLDMPGFFRDAREDILLTEQRFGLFDGLTDEECLEKYPEEARKFNLCKEHSGWFYAQPPNGESRFDVCVRVRQYFGTIIRDAEKSVNSMP